MNHDHTVRTGPISSSDQGGNNSLGMDYEAEPAAASLEHALFWRDIYAEILAMLHV
jgi:hypothetical protein